MLQFIHTLFQSSQSRGRVSDVGSGSEMASTDLTFQSSQSRGRVSDPTARSSFTMSA